MAESHQVFRRFSRAAIRLWFSAILLTAARAAWAGGGPENVVLVVNADSWASQSVANTYIALRHIPAGNVVYLHNLSSFERMEIGAFRREVLGPVLRAIRQRGLEDQIDYLIYSSDLPHTINTGPDAEGRNEPPDRRGWASATGLTYLWQLVMAKDLAYHDLNANYYVRRGMLVIGLGAVRKSWQEIHPKEAAEIEGWVAAKKWVEAEQAIRALLARNERAAELRYLLARCLVAENRPAEAVAELERAIDDRLGAVSAVLESKEFDVLRDREDFQQVVERSKAWRLELQPTLRFCGTDGWLKDGTRGAAKEGRRYLLSTMLAVTSGRGNSVAEALAYLKRSADADGTAPKGTIYLMRNKDVRSTTRDGTFPATAVVLRRLGVDAKILDGVLPKDRPDVAGAVSGSGAVAWAACGSTILPGAICEHLTSSGGALCQGTGQTPLTDFLRYGAAGSSGTVTEPRAIQEKFPLPFMHIHYARGCTLAEAFYQSVAGPYQLLIVGDPLCRPWAKIPTVTVDGWPEAGATVTGVLTLRPHSEAGDTPPQFEMFIDGRRWATCKPGAAFALDTTKLSDGWHELRVVVVAGDVIATQGRVIVPVKVGNRSGGLSVQTSVGGEPVAWDRRVRVEASLDGAKGIRFLHHGRVLGSITGDRGTVELPLDAVGQGPVEIAVVGYLTEAAAGAGELRAEEVVVGESIRLQVVPPEALKPVAKPEGVAWAKGLRLVPDGGEARVVESLLGPWARDGELKKGQAYTLEGWFDVAATAGYQFQMLSETTMVLEVDGRAVGRTGEGRWRMVPVPLEAGTHRVTGRGVYGGSPDVRCGGPGAASLGADRFQCPETSEKDEMTEAEKR